MESGVKLNRNRAGIHKLLYNKSYNTININIAHKGNKLYENNGVNKIYKFNYSIIRLDKKQYQ